MRIYDLTKLKSVYAQHPSDNVTAKYDFIPTTRAVDIMAENGWFPVKATQVKVRKEGKEGYQKHMIRFRQSEPTSLVVRETIIPELVLTNSHNGLSGFNFMAGLFRLVCLNGAVVAAGTVGNIRVRHMGFQAEQVYNAIQGIASNFDMLTDKIRIWGDILLTDAEKELFAQHAASLKYEGKRLQSVNPRLLLAPVRQADAKNDLFTVYNVLQEKLIHGGKFIQKEETKRNHYTGQTYNQMVTQKARGVNNITENVRINQALWSLTEKMAELKTA